MDKLKTLQSRYELKFEKPVPARFKNDPSWIEGKLTEPKTVEKAKKRKLDNDVVYLTAPKIALSFPQLMTKDIAYEEFALKFDKLASSATDEDKEEFVKRANNTNQGKESYCSLSNIKQRIDSSKERHHKSLNKIKGLFVDKDHQTSVQKLVDVADSLSVPAEMLPIVLQKLAIYFNHKSEFLKQKVIQTKVKSFVEKYESQHYSVETKQLEEEIQKLKEALNECPANEFFVETKHKLKAQLREKETTLLTLRSGGETAIALDMIEGSSQVM